MTRELRLPVIIAIVLLAVFIASVIVTEKINIDNLRAENTGTIYNENPNAVSVPPATEKAIGYQENKVAVWIIRLILFFAVPAFFIFTRLSARIRDWIGGRVKRYFIALALFYLIYSVIDYLINFPLDVYSSFIRPHNYGLSNQTFLKWLWDSFLSFGISTIITVLVLWVPYVFIRKSPKRWWLYIGLMSIPMLVFVSYISPLYVDPLFNKFHPLDNKVIESKIDNLMHRTTIGEYKLLQVDKSVDTNQMNAYMTGMFNSKRIVLWDTTINNLNEREVLAIVAHEAGHYLLGHIWKSILIGGLFTIIMLYLVNRSALWLIKRSQGSFGFDKLHDIAALPLLVLVINIFMFVSAPLENAYSRYIEKEADRFELELTKDNHASATAMVKLHWESLSLPTPGLVYKLWLYDHPTFKERVEFANTYKPWEKDESLKYQRYIKE